ncbi:GH3 auxin-responsive promoter [Gymnopilus junonius]|uniref:GH3 auxin-responsive promoter n=1 Tax=Gymnopilus junonius TaxID=109634 RepID=A0A9P5NMN0_GYMJU|nr:GH3 auxin-responsive promoter [Gymnopilus junonius]
MNSFFALMDPSIIFMNATLSTILYDAIRTIEQHWDTMIQAIEQGILPDVEDLGRYRTPLEAFVRANPARAAELRKINVGSAGWLKEIWPSLLVIRVTLSGQYASLQPKLRYHFGPAVSLQSVIYSATECMVGFGYDANNTNLYRLDSNEHIELLDIDKARSPENLSQPSGKKYEVFVTTNDGLWRYALNDIVEVAGFSPADGQPLIKYCERRGVGFRVAGEFVSESELQRLVASLSDMLGQVIEFTTEIDDRQSGVLGAYGFYIELADGFGPDPQSALYKVEEALLKNPGYKKYSEAGFIGKPTLRIVAPGTFTAYRNWKIQQTGFTVGQVKIPTTIIDVEIREWLAKRVFVELDHDFEALKSDPTV